MKIGLLRHFKVDQPAPGMCNSREYDRLCREYDQRDIIPGDVVGDPHIYSICYASPLKRTRETARQVFSKEIIFNDRLVEIPLRAVFQTRIPLPFKTWNIINRTAWAFNSRRVPETRSQSHRRAVTFLEQLLAGHHRDVLIVSHGLFLAALQIEMDRMGFKGREFFRARHGELYHFERDNSNFDIKERANTRFAPTKHPNQHHK